MIAMSRREFVKHASTDLAVAGFPAAGISHDFVDQNTGSQGTASRLSRR